MKSSAIKDILHEAVKSIHYTTRLFERFLDVEDLTVGYEISNSVGLYDEVGTYNISEDIKKQIRDNAEIIEKYNFPKNKSFGIKLVEISIDKKKVDYFPAVDTSKLSGTPLLFVDKMTQSNGNIIYVIVRENEIKTIYFGKNYIPQTTEKLKVDYIVNMKTLKEGKVR